ncbi:MAG: hypothetical protein C0432_01345 [Candidatus Puniceispirillum sp.]|nr:hypothetical protein [Candidatus Pelagibacter sp.]MBA4282926.1 hypothetical protein [Candidatus Puniceispirillum sp.]
MIFILFSFCLLVSPLQSSEDFALVTAPIILARTTETTESLLQEKDGSIWGHIARFSKAGLNGETEKKDHHAREIVSQFLLDYTISTNNLVSTFRLNFLKNEKNLFCCQVLGCFLTLYTLQQTPHIVKMFVLQSMDLVPTLLGFESLFDNTYISSKTSASIFLSSALGAVFYSSIIHVMTKSALPNQLHLPVKETLYDITTQIIPLSIDGLHYSLDKTHCENPLIQQLYPNAYSLRIKRNRSENSLGTFQRTVANGTLKILKFSSSNLMDLSQDQINQLKEVGLLNLKRIKQKLAMKKKLTESEEDNYKSLIAFPLYRSENHLIRLVDEPSSWLNLLCMMLYGPNLSIDAQALSIIQNIDDLISYFWNDDESIKACLQNSLFNQSIDVQQKLVNIFLEYKNDLKSLCISLLAFMGNNEHFNDDQKIKEIISTQLYYLQFQQQIDIFINRFQPLGSFTLWPLLNNKDTSHFNMIQLVQNYYDNLDRFRYFKPINPQNIVSQSRNEIELLKIYTKELLKKNLLSHYTNILKNPTNIPFEEINKHKGIFQIEDSLSSHILSLKFSHEEKEEIIKEFFGNITGINNQSFEYCIFNQTEEHDLLKHLFSDTIEGLDDTDLSLLSVYKKMRETGKIQDFSDISNFEFIWDNIQVYKLEEYSEFHMAGETSSQLQSEILNYQFYASGNNETELFYSYKSVLENIFLSIQQHDDIIH